MKPASSIFTVFFSLLLSGLSVLSHAQSGGKGKEIVLQDIVYRDSTFENIWYKEGTSRIEFIIGKYDILPDYKNNAQELARIEKVVDEIRNTPNTKITNIRIIGYGSPDGSYEFNKRLAANRAQAFANEIKRRLAGISYPIDYKISSVPEDWEGLKNLIMTTEPQAEEAQYLPKEKIIAAIDGAATPEEIKKRVMEIDHGDPYRYMLKHLFPQLRRAYYRIDYETVKKYQVQLADTLTRIVREKPDSVAYGTYYMPNDFRGTIGIKTNLLYWATLTPNIGMDFYIGRRFSIGLEGTYSDWTLFKNNIKRIKKWSNWSTGGELRYWLRSNTNSHFIGLHGNYIDYNFFLNKTGHNGKAYGGGFLYGYSLSVNKRLGFEFEIGIGCYKAKGNKYIYREQNSLSGKTLNVQPTDNYKKYYFGPTKINISLIHRF